MPRGGRTTNKAKDDDKDDEARHREEDILSGLGGLGWKGGALGKPEDGKVHFVEVEEKRDRRGIGLSKAGVLKQTSKENNEEKNQKKKAEIERELAKDRV